MSIEAGPREEQPTQRRALSRSKRWLFRLAILVVLLPMLELISWLGLRFADSTFSFDAIHSTQRMTAATGTAPKDRPEVVHPYMGWILNPQTHPRVEAGKGSLPVNEFGFADTAPTLRKRASGHFLIGIAGGSVAQQLSLFGEQALIRRLSASARLRGAKIEIVRLSFSGFKQPQQLMMLAYLLSLGGELDALVNIDGFNEIALPWCENDLAGVFAAYPRQWYAMTMSLMDPQFNADAFRLFELRAGRQHAAQSILASPLYSSPTRNLIWQIEDAYYERRITDLSLELFAAQEARGRDFAASGPRQLYPRRDAMFPQLVDLWMRSSRQMHHMCRGNGIAYLHILQPNQYLQGSKPMDAEERRTAIRDSECYAEAVRKSYSLLIQEGQKLKNDGIAFRDLTGLFSQISEPIYSDSCCHYNQKGNDIVAEAIADAVLEVLDGKR